MISRIAADRALFGFFLIRFYRSNQKRQIASFFYRRFVCRTRLRAACEKSLEYGVAEIFMLYLSALEPHDDAYLVAACEELVRVVQLRVEVVIADHYGKLYLLRLGALLFFTRFFLFFDLVETEFAVIHYAAYRRRRLRRDKYKIEIFFVCQLSGLFGRHDADGLAVLVDQTDLIEIYFVIDQSVVF